MSAAPLRICSPHCGVNPETTSGGETYERELLVRLGQAGARVELILARGKPHPEGVPNWTVHRFPIGRGLRWYVAPFVVPAAVKRVHDQAGFDVLRVHSLRYIGPGALWARRRYGLDAPVVSHHHHLDRSPLNRLIEKRVIEASEHVITVSEFSRRQLVDELGVAVDHVSVIHNGVDERFAPGARDGALAERLGVGSRPTTLFLGGLKARKNVDLLLEVWPRVLPLVPGAVLLIAGAGPLEQAFRQKAAELGLGGSVIFSGRVAEEEKVRFYQIADLFVSPSSLEGFGLSVAEAMSCGLPVLVANRGALPELTGGGVGAAVFDPGKPQELVEGVAGFLRSQERRAEGGRANRARIDAFFRWDRAVSKVREVYGETLSRWRRVHPRTRSATSSARVGGRS
jgi:glycosyltransferase involved in cell wall biosynthesis